MKQETKKWIEMAEMDYGVAKHLYVLSQFV